MKSMTGFGRGSATGQDFNVAVEIKTVNNRYLDLHLRLGQELTPLEMNIRKLVGARLSEIPAQVRANSIAYVDQDIFLFEGTARDNLTLWEPTVSEAELSTVSDTHLNPTHSPE